MSLNLTLFPIFQTLFQVSLEAFTFIPFLVIAMTGTIVTHKYVKETKNKTYDEIAKRYYERSVDDLVGPETRMCFVVKYL